MDVYAIVTQKIIDLLEQGVVPWRRPWTGSGLPRNVISKKPYRGINHFLLSASKYVQPYWLTMRQTNELGGHIRKGEESTIIVFWKVEDRGAETQDANGTEAGEEPRRRFVLRYYRVWNVEQCELPEKAREGARQAPEHRNARARPIEAVDRIVAGMPNAPTIEYAGSKAFYSSTTDRVIMPPRNLFISAEEYGAILLHELTHSTGAEKRLARESISEAAAFGSATYSKEELNAEMGGAYLCAEAGISSTVIANQAVYVAGWLKKLHDRRLVIQAAAQA